MTYHPDKATGPNRALIEATYVNMKLARDTLINPAKRFAYDRFGPEILQWQHCKTIRDFVFFGVQRTAVYYIGSMSVLVVLGMLGYVTNGKFWRYLVMAGIFATEVYTMTRPQFPGFLTGMINPVLTTTRLRSAYLPFQFLALLRKLAITFFIALSQLAPLLNDPSQSQPSDTITPQHLNAIDALTQTTDKELGRLKDLDLAPFRNDPGSIRELKASLKDWLVQNLVRGDPEVKQAVTDVFIKRREEGSIGP